MKSPYTYPPLACNSNYARPNSSITSSEEDLMAVGDDQNRATNASTPCSFFVRLAMITSRSRWFSFLRKVYHYQNASSSDLGSNPYNSRSWMALEFMASVVQICISTLVLSISKTERPAWPMRIWIVGYNVGCFLSMLLLYGRYLRLHEAEVNGPRHSDLEQQRDDEDISIRTSQLMNRCRTSLELFFAIWFVMGNVWVFDARFGSSHRAPKLYALCITLLSWNAVCYSFPFLLFVLLCCFVPMISSLLGYNMNMGSIHRGASDDQISSLRSWNYDDVGTKLDDRKRSTDENQECCICLTKYRHKEEVRQLPCSHIFHLKCVDQWLRIISCCPLCKQNIQK